MICLVRAVRSAKCHPFFFGRDPQPMMFWTPNQFLSTPGPILFWTQLIVLGLQAKAESQQKTGGVGKTNGSLGDQTLANGWVCLCLRVPQNGFDFPLGFLLGSPKKTSSLGKLLRELAQINLLRELAQKRLRREYGTKCLSRCFFIFWMPYMVCRLLGCSSRCKGRDPKDLGFGHKEIAKPPRNQSAS